MPLPCHCHFKKPAPVPLPGLDTRRGDSHIRKRHSRAQHTHGRARQSTAEHGRGTQGIISNVLSGSKEKENGVCVTNRTPTQTQTQGKSKIKGRRTPARVSSPSTRFPSPRQRPRCYAAATRFALPFLSSKQASKSLLQGPSDEYSNFFFRQAGTIKRE